MFRFAASTLPVTLRQMGLVAMACSVAALSACGGGSRSKDYQPDRIVSFGDENSMIDSFTSGNLFNSTGSAATTLRGLTYTVNSVVASTSSYCALASGTVGTGSIVACSSDDSTVSAFDSTTGVSKGIVLDPTSPNVVTLITTGLATISAATNQNAQKSLVTGYNCAVSSIWIQVIAHNFGKGYQTKCPLDTTGAETYATYGARVDGVAQQVAANRGALGKGVLVTLMVGQWDILDMYAAVQGGMPQADAEAELKSRADTMANVVKDIISTGAKVVLALTPDLGQSPRALGGNQTSLTALTKAFNDKLYITDLGNQSGRDLAGVSVQNVTDPSLRAAGIDYTDQACNLTSIPKPDGSTAQPSDPDAVKYCTGYTLNSTTTTYIWADDIHGTPYLHGLIGSAGVNRALNQLTVD